MGLGPSWPRNVEYGDIVRGLPVAPESCQAVYSSHVLEHLALEDFRAALQNTFGYLKAGGTFRFVLPDLEEMVKNYVDSTSPDAALKFLSHTQLGLKTRPRGISGLLTAIAGNSKHLWMWDYEAMVAELSRIGFQGIRRAYFDDADDPMFDAVEDESRWHNALGIECVK